MISKAEVEALRNLPAQPAREIAAADAARNAAIERRISASLAQLNRDLDERVANCRLEAAELGQIMHVQDLYEGWRSAAS